MKLSKIKKFLKYLYYYFLIRISGLFDKSYYSEKNQDIGSDLSDPIKHYLQQGGFEGRDPGPDFDSSWYLEKYKDVNKAKFNPLAHYLIYGKKEGRLPNKETASPPPISMPAGIVVDKFEKPEIAWQPYLIKGKSRFKKNKPIIIVVSHEASLTGAPLLSLNIAQQLNKQYNVIIILIKNGDLFDNFRDESILVIAPPVQSLFDYSLLDGILNETLKKYKVQFAIVNSMESRPFLGALSTRFVPIVHLIHEFAAYTRPLIDFQTAALWAHKTIYSTSITYENAVKFHPVLEKQNISIIPQGKCVIPPLPKSVTLQKIGDEQFSEFLNNFDASPKRIIILGAGFVQIRKGVDLFIACAAKLANSTNNVKFVWIGDNYDPSIDLAYSTYLAEQIHRSGLENDFYLFESTSDIEKAYQAADILLVSSRLDPLPNVAIDMMFHKKPVLCFDKATGIAEILKNNGLQEHCVAPYMDVESISIKLEKLVRSDSLRIEVGEKSYQIATKVFNMENYVNQLEQIGFSLEKQVLQEEEDFKTIKNSDLARMDFYVSRFIPYPSAIQYYVRSWASGIGKRKLFPGFHPGIYLDQHPQIENKRDPLADYIDQNQPDGPWDYPLLTDNSNIEIDIKKKKIGLHIHAFYIDLLPEILERLNKNDFLPDLLISISTKTSPSKAAHILNNYKGRVVKITQVPNRGRDIGPFLIDFKNTILDQYEIIGHVHTKKTPELTDIDLEIWKTFLLENLIGGKSNMSDIILRNMVDDTNIGMVFPDDPHVLDWRKNLQISEILASRLGINNLPKNFNFPVGTMFWTRVDAIRALFNLNLNITDFPEEPLPYDGTILHAIERLLPFISEKAGYRNILTNVEGVTR